MATPKQILYDENGNPITATTTSTSTQRQKSESESTTTGNTKSKQNGTTSSTSQKISPFLNDDGTPNQEAERYFKEQYGVPLQQRYHIDPNTGDVDTNLSLSGVLGVDTEALKKLQEEKLRRNKFKRISGNLYNSLSVLNDIISAGIGGNVYKRDAYQGAKEAIEDSDKIKEDMIKQQADAAQAKENLRNAYLDALMKARADYVKDFSKTVNNGTSETSADTNTINNTKSNTESTTTTSSTQEHFVHASTSSANGTNSGGGTNGKSTYLTIPIRTQNGDDFINLPLSDNQAEVIGKTLSSFYNKLSSDKKNVIKDELAAHGINPKENGTYDGKDLLAAGVVFNDKTLFNIIRDVIEQNITDETQRQELINAINFTDTDFEDDSGILWWKKNGRGAYSTNPVVGGGYSPKRDGNGDIVRSAFSNDTQQ